MFGRRRAVTSVDLPTRPGGIGSLERVTVTVLSPNEVVSPLSGMRAALFLVRFTVHVSPGDPRSRSAGASVDHVLGEGAALLLSDEQLGDEVRLDLGDGRGQVTVPPDKRVVTFQGADGIGGTMVERMPPRWSHLLRRGQTRGGTIYAQELSLSQGDQVQLTARIERVGEQVDAVGETSYRQSSGTSGALFLARADLGPVSIVEQLPSF